MNPLKMLSRGGAVSEPSDADFENVTLLLHGDGTNGAQNNTFLDSSTNNFTITRNGNTTQGTFTPFSKPDGRWGNYFDGTGDYLQAAANSAFSFGSGDFTIECWYYPINFSQIAVLVDTRNGGASTLGVAFYVGTSGQLALYTGGTTTPGNIAVSANGAVVANAWNHLVALRSGSSVAVYVNGASAGTGTNSFNFTDSNCFVGRTNESASNFAFGYLSNVRIVKGTAVYTSNFTPSTTPLTAISGTSLLTCQSNRFKDNSSNNFTITANGDVKVTPFSPFPTLTAYSAATNGGSGYFDGSGDRLETPSITIGTNNFCFECWLYPTVTQGTAATIFTGNNTSSLQLSFFGNSLGIAQRGVAWQVTGSAAVPISSWSHVAFVRSGTGTNQTSIYLNGTRIANGTVSFSYVASAYQFSGTNAGAAEYQGYMSGVRFSNGSTPYDATQSTITIPTAPANPTGSALCLNFTNAGIIDNSMSNNLETVGNAQIDTTTKKYGTGALEFDGNGDNLSFPNNELTTNFGTGDFTIEGWVYPVAYSGTAIYPIFIANSPNDGSNAGEYALYLNHPVGSCILYYNTGSLSSLSGGSVVSTGSWSHIALTRASGTVRFFINGTQQFSGTISGSLGVTTGNTTVGVRTGNTSQTYFNGYIDDLRITKGKARYTSNFTPPTAALPDIGE